MPVTKSTGGGAAGVFRRGSLERDIAEAVAYLGCGPGKVTAHLAALGVPVSGVDRSPRMIEPARTAYPELCFTPTIRSPASPICCR
ncbi:methyltransferase domain-containing protein [Streptomyces sp. SID7499]|uniref:Methyltransferase domain-containing protein n=1 Tax=Streptomyces sp. SID7499 TaxID=2706086 RepID=A0A6G3X999_9ACTN|nr:methyltransferase domain-containing protein [Streptomyces sp. SID7499]